MFKSGSFGQRIKSWQRDEPKEEVQLQKFPHKLVPNEGDKLEKLLVFMITIGGQTLVHKS